MTSRAPPPAPRERAAWWIKCDPTAPAHGGWNWPDLFTEYRPGEPYTWSVGTALSQKNARLARPKEPVVGYAAGEGFRAVLALAEVEAGAVFVPGARAPSVSSALPGGFTVAIRPVALLSNPVALEDVRHALRRFEPEFFRTRFGSIFRIRDGELRAILAEVRRRNPGLRVPSHWPALPSAATKRARG